MLITKSRFVAGSQYLKRLYFIVHSPELAAQPDESGLANDGELSRRPENEVQYFDFGNSLRCRPCGREHKLGSPEINVRGGPDGRNQLVVGARAGAVGVPK